MMDGSKKMMEGSDGTGSELTPAATKSAGDKVTDQDGYDFLKLNVRLGQGETVTCDAMAGMRLLDLLRASSIPIKAECGGACVCATCHIKIPDKWFDLIPEASNEELHKLDEIPGAEDNSRLACQIEMTKQLDGLEFEITSDSLSNQKIEAAE